jgi:hypothetical protein
MPPIEALRTPDERFADLPDFPYPPRYVSYLPGFEGLRVHYLDVGLQDAYGLVGPGGGEGLLGPRRPRAPAVRGQTGSRSLPIEVPGEQGMPGAISAGRVTTSARDDDGVFEGRDEVSGRLGCQFGWCSICGCRWFCSCSACGVIGV